MSDFERFVAGMLGQAATQAIQRVAAPPPPMPAPVPAAPAALPPQLMAAIAAAAQQAGPPPVSGGRRGFMAQDQPQPMGPPIPVTPYQTNINGQLVGTPTPAPPPTLQQQADFGNTLMRDVRGLVLGPTSPPPPAPPVAPTPGDTPQTTYGPDPTVTAYQTVSYDAGDGRGTQIFLVPVERVPKQLPQGAVLLGDPVTPDRAKSAQPGQFLDAQPPAVQALFPTPTTAQIQANNAQTEQDNAVKSSPNQTVPAYDKNGQVVQVPAAQAGKSQVPGSQPTVYGPEDLIMRNQPPPTPGTLPPTTPSDVAGVSEANAALLRKEGITEIPDGQMAVRQGDNVTLYPAGAQLPRGAQIIAYGGKTEKPNPPPMMTTKDILGIPVPVPSGQLLQDAGNLYDKARQESAGLLGDVVHLVTQNGGNPLTDLSNQGRSLMGDVFRNTPLGWAYEKLLGEPGSPLTQLISGGRGQEGLDATFGGFIQQVNNAYENGYNGYTGGRAVWELFQSTQQGPFKLIWDLVIDPLNWLPGGGFLPAGEKAANAIRGAEELIPLWRDVLAEGVTAGSRILGAPEKGVEIVGNVLGKGAEAVKAIPGVGNLLDKTTQTKMGREATELLGRLNDFVNQTPRNVAEQAPPPGAAVPPEAGPVGGAPKPPTSAEPVPAQAALPNEPVPAEAAVPNEPAAAAPEARPVEQLADNVRRTVAADGSRVIELRQPDGTWREIAREGGPAVPTPAPAEPVVVVGGSSLANPFQGTALDRSQLAEAPDHWGFLSPQKTDNRVITEAARLGQQYPDKWAQFVAEHDDAARAFIKTQVSGRYADNALAEANYVINDLYPDFLRTFGDVAPLPDYQWHFRPGQDAGAKARNFMTADREVVVERAIFEPDPKVAQAAQDAIKRRGFKLDANGDIAMTASGKPMVKDGQLAAVYDQIAPTRDRYLALRQQRPVFENTPLAQAATPQEATTQATGFQTAKGSTYTVQADGTTIRNKSYHPEHGAADVGLKPASQETVYLTEENAQPLSIVQARGGERKAIVTEGDHAAVKYVSGPNAGKIIQGTVVPIEREPRVGLLPLETWNDGTRTHFGNEIVRVDRPEAAPLGETPQPSQAPQAPVEPATPVPPVEQAPPPINAPAAPLPEFQRVPLDQVTTARQQGLTGAGDYQMRKADYAEASVQNIVDNYNPQKFEPIEVTPNPNGTVTVLSGHSRYEAAKRLNLPDVPIKIVRGDAATLKEIALTSNTRGTALTPTERGLNIRRQMDELGKDIRQVAKDEKITRSTAERYVATTHLPDDLQQLVDSGHIDLNTGAVLGNAINDGTLSTAEAQNFYREQVLPEKYSASQTSDVLTIMRQMKEAAGAQQGGLLFDGLDLGSTGAADAFAKINDLARLRRQVSRQASVLERAGKLAKPSAEQTAMLADLRAQQADIERQLGIGAPAPTPEPVATAPEPTPIRTVQTTAGPQGAMDLGAANRPVMQTGAATPGEAVTASDLLQPAELTPEQIAQQQRDAGQADLFGIGGPDVNAAADKPIFARLFPDIPEMGRQYAAGVKELGRMLSTPVPNPAFAEAAAREPLTRSVGPVMTIRGRIVGDVEGQQLNRRFADGQTILQKWDQRATELERGGQGPQQAGFFQNAGMDRQSAEIEAAGQVANEFLAGRLKEIDPEAYTRYEAEFKRLTTGKNAQEPNEARLVALMRASAKKRLPIYDEATAILREGILYNSLTGWRYVATQGVGNTVTAILTRKFDIIGQVLDPGQVLPIYRELRDRLPQDVLDIEATRLASDLGMAGLKRDVFETGREEGVNALGPTHTQKLADRLRLGKWSFGDTRAGKIASKLYANSWVRDMANSLDVSSRVSLWGQEVMDRLPQARQDLLDAAIQQRPMGVTEQAVRDVFDTLPRRFDSDLIRQAFDDAGFKATYGDRVARDWRNAVSRMDQMARDEVRRVFFSGDMTNLDQIFGRFAVFHYWLSRATPLYIDSMVHNPGMLNAYANMMQAAHDSSNGYPATVRNFYKFMLTPMGYNLFLRPDAFFQVMLPFWNESGYAPDGENWLGKQIRTSAFFLNPILDTALNFAGAKGDTFAPDPLMLGQWTRLVTTGLDFAKGQGWIKNTGPTGDAYAQLTTWLRSKTSGYLGTTNIPDRDQRVYARRTINQLILDVAKEQGLAPDDPVVLGAMDDPSSALYQEAFSRYANEKATDQILRTVPVTAVLYPKSRPASPDERGIVIATAPKNSPEQQAAYNARDVSNITDPRSRALNAQDSQYYALGTPRQQAAYSTYYAIKNGDLKTPVMVGGQQLTPELVATMDQTQLDQAARTWVVENNAAQDIVSLQSSRDAFLAANPDYAAYKDWAKQVRGYPGGAEAWWRDTAVANPNAARYLATIPANDPSRDYKLTGLNGYLAYSGIPASYRDYTPAQTRDPSKVPYNAATEGPLAAPQQGGGSGQTFPVNEQTITRDIEVYQRKVAAYNAQIGAVMGQANFDINNVNPMARSAIVANFRDQYGLTMPTMGSAGAGYVKWAQVQAQQGAPTDIAAYLAWRDQQKVNDLGAGPVVLDPTTTAAAGS